jgi:hypothetical protein
VYSKYDKGSAKGDGIWWSADRKSAFTLVDGEKKVELLVEEAEALAKEMFNLPIPEIYTPSPATVAMSDTSKATDTRGNSAEPSEIERLWIVDNGDRGAYEGKLVDGLRSRKGKMVRKLFIIQIILRN